MAPPFEAKSLYFELLDVERYRRSVLTVKILLLKTSTVPKKDHVDRFLEEIEGELPPGLDIEVEGIVDRIGGINRRVQRELDRTLADHGLSHTDWRILSSLRWAGPPYRRSAGALAKIADLSSGAMTNRLDQLENAGLVRRVADPDDRRGVLVEPTDKGRGLWEAAIGVQARKEALLAEALNERERRQLNTLLRRVMLAFEEHEGEEPPKKG
jgi:DNA-binding MarR family transcriptional regulator